MGIPGGSKRSIKLGSKYEVPTIHRKKKMVGIVFFQWYMNKIIIY